MIFQNDVHQELMSEINVTPLVDVMLVLLVVFIVTAPVFTQVIGVRLPGTVATSTSPSAHRHVLRVDIRGVLQLDGQGLNDEELQQQLIKLASEKKGGELEVQADAAVPYGRVAQVMAMAQKAQIDKLSFMTKHGNEDAQDENQHSEGD